MVHRAVESEVDWRIAAIHHGLGTNTRHDTTNMSKIQSRSQLKEDDDGQRWQN